MIARSKWINLVFSAILFNSPLATLSNAAECDCKAADCEGLKDYKEKVNDFVNQVLKQKPGSDTAIHDKFGKGAAHTALENWLTNPENWEAAKYGKQKKQADTKYKDLNGSDAFAWTAADTMGVISPCILLCGKCIGADKVGHFFQQGFEYAAEYDKAYQKATGTEAEKQQAAKDAAEKWNKSTEYATPGDLTTGIYGERSTGVMSKADMEANRKGGEFYRKLREKGANFVFDICDYVNDDWSEENNPNDYTDAVKKKLKGAK